MTSARSRRLTGVLAVAALSATGLALASPSVSAVQNGPTMDIQLLSFNDFHGNLEPPSGSSGRLVTGHALDDDDVDRDGVTNEPIDVTTNVGGVEFLATHLKELRAGRPYTATVAAGDIVGASPLLSAAFHDEPTIEAMNALGLDVTSVGNHEFDEGYKELQRLDAGGCLDDGDGAANQDSCPGGKSFAGANFPFLAANVTYAGTDETILPPYYVKSFKGAKIGFIGMTLEATPDIVTQAGVEGLEFKDEVETANALVPILKEQGVNAIVVLVHEGGFPTSKQSWTDRNGKTWSVNAEYDYTCDNGGSVSGPIVDISKNLSPAIDMVISGHTHSPYVCNIPDPAGQQRMVTSASSFGRLVTETTLTYDRRTQDIVRSSVEGSNVMVTRDRARDAAQTEIITRYKTLVAPIANRVIGNVATDVTRTANAAGESQLGDLIADAQLADPSVVTGGQEPVIAFMNPGGIRADLGAGEVTYEEAFTVQPFNNYLVSMDLTGAQIKQLLKEQVTGANAASNKILQVSQGFSYTWSADGTISNVMLDGAAVADGTTYRIVTNNFLSDGGDGFPTFRGGQDKYFGGLDIDAFANYLEANSPYTPGALTRITKQ
ncbi:bifunctional UDP-sugar hydrolase/5'-nucleotidase [Knoellia sp. p5-6-4]|uniref:bifunctional metallophosphatase/5'-nucleotidase n=1 Tax=unclassified Knoellia TaxID=2618719 RepID=UPI0023DA6492|nr:bifunctional metallophosphatase/5'-nucleotidase [Knoellia sp. p5-6-4]MDF2145429.1 bifunctional metallophosphatase/5'-nucleotidase [Knoellia sp. p5-6-4]